MYVLYKFFVSSKYLSYSIVSREYTIHPAHIMYTNIMVIKIKN